MALSLTACGGRQTDVMENGPGAGGQKIVGRRVINLFGLRDAERHLIEVGTLRGQLFLLHQDRETGEFEWVDCPLETPYEYMQHPKRTHEMEIHSTAELQTELPMSQSQFQASIERGNWFKFSWAAVGSYTPGKFQLPRTNAECSRATHFVQLLTVGAVTWSEMTGTSVEAGVDAKVVKVGGKMTGGEKSEDVLGSLDACFADESGQSGADCKIPLQVSVASLRDHHWCPEGNRACEAATSMATSTCLEPGPGCLPKPDGNAPPATGGPTAEVVPIYRGAANASRFMSEAMEKAFALREKPAFRSYGYSDTGPLLYAGLVKSGDSLEAIVPMEAGAEYALLAAGDSDAQDLDLSVSGAASASESNSGKESELRFRASQSGTASVVLKGARVGSPEGAFVALIVLKKGGTNIAADTIRGSIRRNFERGELVTQRLEANRFHEGEWAFYVLGMKGGVFRQSGVRLPVGTSYAFAVADENATDIDIGLVSGDEMKEVDAESDAMPIVSAERTSPIVADLLVASEGSALTVVSAAILEKREGGGGGGAAMRAPCDPNEFPEIRVGTRIVLGRHTPFEGDDNWADEMSQYVGRSAVVTERVGTDKTGCNVVRVDVDSGSYAWRLRDVKLDQNGIPTSGPALSHGRWLIAKRGDMVVVWRADNKVAAEFWDGSNGWWNWLTGGTSYTVWSAGTKDPDPGNFKAKPWTETLGTPKKPTASEYTSGNQTYTLSGDSIVVKTADGGFVTFRGDGTVQFKTFRGTDVKM